MLARRISLTDVIVIYTSLIDVIVTLFPYQLMLLKHDYTVLTNFAAATFTYTDVQKYDHQRK